MNQLRSISPKRPFLLLNVMKCFPTLFFVGGAVASWLVRSTPDQAVRVQDLARDIALCSWARHLTLTVPLSTQVFKWVPVNLCWS